MLYAAKCYWPGVTEHKLEQAAAQLYRVTGREPGGSSSAAYLGSLLFPSDELVLCLFEAQSTASVKRASERAGIPCERVMTAIRLDAHKEEKEQIMA